MDEIFGKIGTPQTLSQKIERRIEEAIRNKKLLAGTKLPSERELCEVFAVSRTALREALRKLSAKGLIHIKKGSGIYVNQLKIEDAIESLNLYYDLSFDTNLISQIIEVCNAFEPEIARMAAYNRSEKDIHTLNNILFELSACHPDNIKKEAEILNRFHLSITKATGNKVMIISMEPIYSLLPRIHNLIHENADDEKYDTFKNHQAIFEAIRDKDGKKAFYEMASYIDRTLEIYSKSL